MAIDPARWRRLRPLLEQAMDLDPGARDAFVDALHGEDAALRDDLRALLAQQASGDARLDRPAVARAAPALLAHLEGADADARRLGTSVGGYRLVALLGSGGMGAVYLAERDDRGFAQRVALKLVRAAVSGAAARERFVQERRILAQLRHPHIATLLDGGETAEGLPWFTLDYVEGQPITTYCRERGLDLRARLALLLKAADALAYAHRSLVVHRDIKPSNLLVTADGVLKLLDFGIAKLLDEAPGAGLTRHALGPMTPEYAAPEQFRRARITVATDVYQFGMLAFRLLTGRLPYRADPEDTLGWARAVTEEEPLTLPRAVSLGADGAQAEPIWASDVDRGRLRRALAGDLDAVVRRALAKAPEARYPSMEALSADLEAYLAGRPVAARRGTRLYRASRFVRRHAVAVGFATLAAGALVGGAAVALHQAGVAREEAARALREAERARAAMHFVTGMFQVADPSVNQGIRLTADAILARGTERLERELAHQPALQAAMAAMIGELHVALGNMPAAYSLLARAIETLARDPGTEPRQLARALERGAHAAARSGRAAQAEEWIAALQPLTDGGAPEDEALRVEALLTLATIARDRMHPDLALAHTEDALARSRRLEPGAGNEGERTARVRLRYVTLLADVGRYVDARRELERVRAIYLRLFGPDDVRMLRVDESDGWLRRLGGDLEGARAILERNSERIAARIGPRSSYAANNLYDRALVYRDAGELARAQAAFEEVGAIWTETSGPHATEVGWALWNAATIARDRGAHDEALALLDRVAATWGPSMPADDVAMGVLQREYAHTWRELGRLDAARAAAERSLAILRSTAPDRPELASSLAERAAVARAAGDANEARRWTEEALAVAERAGDEALARRLRDALAAP